VAAAAAAAADDDDDDDDDIFCREIWRKNGVIVLVVRMRMIEFFL
jgi:hypothetical protein